MAESEAGQTPQDLECPLCLDVFNDATLLGCGHTFCKNCLREHDRTQRVPGHMVCPVCRKCTPLGPMRVEELSPNVVAKGLIDDIKSKLKKYKSRDQAPSCVQHKRSKEMFCYDCSIFVCVDCLTEDHEGHRVASRKGFQKKKEAKINDIQQLCKNKEAELNKQIRALEEEKQKVISCMGNVRMKIKAESEKRMKVIKKNEKSLLDEVASKEKEYCDKLDVALTIHRRVIEDMTRAITMVRNDLQKSLEGDSLAAHDLVCSDLDNLLKQTIDEETARHVRENAQRARFVPIDETVLALGRLDLNKGSEAGESQQTIGEKVRNVESTARVSKSTAKSNTHNVGSTNLRKSYNVARGSMTPPGVSIPSSVASNSLNIVRRVDLPELISGMAVMSQDTVVVGYGGWRDGADCYRLSGGDVSCHHMSIVGEVRDIAFLTDGRSVVSHGDTIRVYNADGSPAGIQYTRSGYARLCIDHHDNIYSVNGDPDIHIFQGADTNSQRVVRTGSHKPRQICVTKTGVMITSTCWSTPSTVMVHDRDGYAGSSITASDRGECLYAAVDSQDRVFVARVRERSDILRLSVYTLDGTTLVKQREFNELKIHRALGSIFSMWCYIACLTPDLLTFANAKSLYFVTVPS